MPLFIFLYLALTTLPVAAEVEKPKLVVMLAIDQLRRDRLDGAMPGGLGKLIREGRVFTQAQLDHAATSTCPGHVVMLSGMNPGNAGIPGNEFIDTTDYQMRYCVDDRDSPVFGSTQGRSPENLTVSTLGDWLKEFDPSSLVFSIGGKDRSAITLGGKRADAVYWFDSAQVAFTSSQFYMPQLPDYLLRFNGDATLGTGFMASVPATWEHPSGTARRDDFSGEETKYSNVSGHPLNQGEKIGDQFYHSPYVDTATLDLAKLVISEEKLGQRDSTDLLAIALAASDPVGHYYGPYSAESEDTLRRLDQGLATLLAYLDEVVGNGRYVIALSSDHGVAELPEWSIANDRMSCPEQTGRIGLYGFLASLYGSLYWHFTFPLGNPANLVKIAGGQLTVDRHFAAEHDINVQEVLSYLEAELESRDTVTQVWTVEEMAAPDDPLAALYKNSYVAGRSGDLAIQPHPDCQVSGGTGTNHGTPYDHDRDIPLIFFGQQIDRGASSVDAHSVDIAPTLADLLKLDYPAGLDGKVLPIRAAGTTTTPTGD